MDLWGTLKIQTVAPWLSMWVYQVSPPEQRTFPQLCSETCVMSEEGSEEYKVAGFEKGGSESHIERCGSLNAESG
jgi:hypothetical protein